MSGIFANPAMLVDTDVLIWFFRGKPSAKTVIGNCPRVGLSAVTYMELVQGARNRKELRVLRRTIAANAWQILPINETISHRATIFVENHTLSHGMQLADALIAATAIETDLTLITANTRHYRFLTDISLRRYRP